LTTATANLGAAPELNIEHPTIQTGDDANGAVDYDEETFYNPELEDIDLQTFWAEDLETANRVLEPLNELDFTDSSIHQFQPEHPPIEDDITPPDFTLDAPMSDLFIPIAIPVEGTVAFPSEDRAKLPASQAEVAPEIVEDRAKLPASQTEVDPEIVSSILQSEDYANANSDILFLEDLNRDDLPKSTPAIFQWEDYANANSDVLFLEDLNRNELSKSFAQDNIATGVTDWVNESSDPHQKNADFADLNLGAAHLASVVRPTTDDSENRLGIGDFKELNLVEIDELDSITDATNDCDFVDLNLQPILQESDYVDSNLDLISDLDIHDNFFGSNLDEINELDFGADAVIHDNFSELNIENINELKSSDNPIFYDSFGGLNIADIEDLPEIGNDLGGLNIADTEDLPAAIDTLAIDDNFAQLNLEDIGDIHSIASPDEMLRQSDWADLNIEDIGGSKSRIDPPLDASFANSNLDDLGNLELNINTSTQLDLIHSNLEDIDRANSQQFANIDLESNLGSDRDFADLDFEHMGLGLGDLSDLDFDDDLSSDPLLDLDKLVSDNPIATATELADLNSLIIGGAAIGVGGALLSTAGSELDDLDALVSNPTPVATPDNSLSDLDSLLTTPAPVVEPVGAKTNKKTTERRSKQRTFDPTMKVSVKHLNNLNNLVGELVVNRNTLEQDQNRMRQFIEKLLSEVQKLNEVGKRMQDLYERSLMENSLIASRQQSKNVAAPPLARIENLDNISEMEYDPLEMDRFTPIHLLSQKMIELTVRIRESTSDIEFVVDGSTEVTRTLRQITGQLQEDLTKSRMIPFAQTADRLQRGVRENGLKYGKQVELAIEGRDTLIDKVILESLTDPLIHMVNNGIAHGIESPETRQQFDKPPTGKISIRALHQGNQTIISISDDGAGINTEIVKTKAIQKGIITAKQAATMTKAEVYELLFLPSFSTKDQADELAGRGVGMDVVRTSLAEIRGTITTESQIGLGTTFTIRLPLALSIAKALIAIDNKTNIAFPMDGIEDTQDVSPEQIQKNNQGESCIFWRDSLMPFKPLSDLLGFNRPLPRNNFYPTQDDDNDLVSILILRSDGNLIAVQVDKITGEQEIAIKPLQGPASKPVGIAGATVLGDGRIVPIADVMELIDLAKGKITRHISTKWSMETSAPTSERRESMVLIVDDSITVRELLSLTFKRAGYRVEQARDGQEAWDKLRAGLPCDIVFCDIEMPRMDGLEFLSRVQKDVALSKVPVAMLTSRGSDRHRQIAAQLGASGYFIKPYLEEALLDAAKRMIRGEFLAIV
jgi:chemotaxis protein histidine kinase CheA/ActR/RegA family two-component response regulator